jgi:hypothetical protein
MRRWIVYNVQIYSQSLTWKMHTIIYEFEKKMNGRLRSTRDSSKYENVIQQMLVRLKKHALYINLQKYKFNINIIKFLKFVINHYKMIIKFSNSAKCLLFFK